MPALYAWVLGIASLFVLSLSPGVAVKNLLIPVAESSAQCAAGTSGERQSKALTAVPGLDGGRCSLAAMTAYRLLSESDSGIPVSKRIALVKTLSEKLNACSFCNIGEGLFIWRFRSKASEWFGEAWKSEVYWSPAGLKEALDVQKTLIVALNSAVLWGEAKKCDSVPYLKNWNGKGGGHFVVIFASEGSLKDGTLSYWVADGGIPTTKDDHSGYNGEQSGAVYLVDAATIHRAISTEQKSLWVPMIYYKS